MEKEEKGKILFKIDEETKKEFKEYCERQGRTMSGQLTYWIKQALIKEKYIGGGNKEC